MVLNPRHRGDCAVFFVATHQTHRVQLDGPADVIGEIEHAAALAGRTLLRPCRFRLSEAKDWNPFTCLWRKTARVATMKERESY